MSKDPIATAGAKDEKPTGSGGALRFFWTALLLLLVGIAAAAAVQIGFNVLRYLIQPDWLAGRRFRLIVALAGMLAALALALVLAAAGRGRRSYHLRVLAVFGAAVADPYFFAYLGWRSAPAYGPLFALGRASLLWWALAPSLTGRRPAWPAVAVLAAILLLAASSGRFWLVPQLPGDLETAAMAPIHLLVFARTAILVVLGAGILRLVDGTKRKEAPG